ncbi:MAG: phosphotransacetylase family protein [Desulfovibrio sp.]|jgi:BioD-like phosphotransacetylase family protein
MPGLYIGSTSGYSGKNTITAGLGLGFQQAGLKVGYMKPVGAMPIETEAGLGDEDALFVRAALGLAEDPAHTPAAMTPVVVTHDFKMDAFEGRLPGVADGGLVQSIASAYKGLAQGRDLMLVAGSGSMYSGKYSGVDAISVVKALGIQSVVIDRFEKELNYDLLLMLKEQLGDNLSGVILNDVPPAFLEEVSGHLAPFLEARGIPVLGILPRDPLMGSITVGDLAQRLGGKIISAHHKTDRVVSQFLIGTMQVENFMLHFRKKKNAAVIVGGDRADVQLVALEGDCPCLVLTGNLYPNDVILTRSEVLETSIIIVREDTFTVAKKMENLLTRHKMRDAVKVRQGAELVARHLRLDVLRNSLGL